MDDKNKLSADVWKAATIRRNVWGRRAEGRKPDKLVSRLLTASTPQQSRVSDLTALNKSHTI